MSIDDAKDKARELAKTVKTDKQDPREIERQQKEAAAIAKAQQDAATAAAAQAASAAALTMAEVWAAYIEERKPHWGDLHYRDHIDKAKAGGLPSGRRGGGYPPEWWHKFNNNFRRPKQTFMGQSNLLKPAWIKGLSPFETPATNQGVVGSIPASRTI